MTVNIDSGALRNYAFIFSTTATPNSLLPTSSLESNSSHKSVSHSCHMIIFTISLLLCYINSAVLVHIVVGKLLGSVLLILCNVVGLGWRKRVHGRKQVHTFGQDNKRIHVLFLIRPPMLISCTLLTYELFTRMYSGYKNICFSLLLPKYFMQQRTRIKVINYLILVWHSQLRPKVLLRIPRYLCLDLGFGWFVVIDVFVVASVPILNIVCNIINLYLFIGGLVHQSFIII